ncbi:MAG TPA: hypothetical protein VF070_45405 [Streptosporangiaceae bacterium]
MSRLIRRRAAAEVLERRYRRLLACYPAAYRRANAEEMLGVALARSSAGRRKPELGEAVSLIVSGIGKRVGGARTGYRDPAWRDAGGVLAVLGPIVLASFSARDVIGAISGWGLPLVRPVPPRSNLALAAGWAIVAVAAICGRRFGRGWRAVAATGACAGAAGQSVVLALEHSGNLSGLVTSWWKLVFALVIAASAVIAVRGEGRQPSWRLIMAVAIAGAAIAAYPAVESATVTVTPLPGGGSIGSSPLYGVGGLIRYALLAVGWGTMLMAIGRCRPEVRRRIVVLLLPTAATAALVTWTFGGFLASSPRFVNPVALNEAQWTALALFPVAGFAVGLWWLRRYERFLSSLSAK